MGNRYQSELDEFHENFDCFRGKRIVLYGIGRYTATLIDGIKDHCFVGLLDKDPENVGKIMFGLPILTINEAEELADMVIINTSGTYWNVIYKRIKGIKIPVYFLNGSLAEEKEICELDTIYWNSSEVELYQKIDEVDVVSFDFFDTLFSRKICNPRDLFTLLERESITETGFRFPYRELRNSVIQELNEDYSLYELYQKMAKKIGGEEQKLAEIYVREIQLEKNLLVPRTDILKCLEHAKKSGKEVYIVSDMYLPKSFYCEVLDTWKLEIDEARLLISCEERKSKKRGSLWKEYSEKNVKGKKALHIGDDWAADIKIPQAYGIETYYIASQIELMRLSTIRDVEPHIVNTESSFMMALVLNKLFANPFRLNAGKGRVAIQDAAEMGYVVFGPVINAFLNWITKQVKRDKITRLVFLSRDGFFLKENFEYYTELQGEKIECCYLGISRQLAMTASIQTETELWKFINMPYSGTDIELLEDRFNIKAKPDESGIGLLRLYEIYKENIWDYVKRVRENYVTYLSGMNLDNDCAIVDLGFYGNNQRYLNELTELQMQGYYFNADLSKDNKNAGINDMKACFQSMEDEKGKKSKILEKQIFIESFLTAPYGMVKAVSQEGELICAEGHGNQKMFHIKRKINDGVQQYIKDCSMHIKSALERETYDFIDFWYGLCMSGGIRFSEEIKKSFYNDNAMMNRIESMLFY